MPRSGSPLLLLAVILATACNATCKQACEVLLECEDVENARVALTECQASCERQQKIYDDWGDPEYLDAFQQELDCIVDSSCEQVSDGVCYNDDLYAF